MATIVASFVAIFTLLIWRKQQRYSAVFKAIMDLEDNYELILSEYAVKYKWLFHHQKYVAESANEPKDKQILVNEEIKKNYAEFVSKDKLAQVQANYDLAYIRALRFDASLESHETLPPTALRNFFEKTISPLNPELFLSEFKEAEELERFAYSFTGYKKSGLDHLKTIRESL